jgi:hypothetical protein
MMLCQQLLVYDQTGPARMSLGDTYISFINPPTQRETHRATFFLAHQPKELTNHRELLRPRW